MLVMRARGLSKTTGEIRGRRRTLARSHASAPSVGSILRDIPTGVPSQDFINKGLIPDAASTCFLAELIEHARIDSNRDQLARFVAERRATDAPHRLQLRRR